MWFALVSVSIETVLGIVVATPVGEDYFPLVFGAIMVAIQGYDVVFLSRFRHGAGLP